MKNNEDISLATLRKICKLLDCNYEEIIKAIFSLITQWFLQSIDKFPDDQALCQLFFINQGVGQFSIADHRQMGQLKLPYAITDGPAGLGW